MLMAPASLAENNPDFKGVVDSVIKWTDGCRTLGKTMSGIVDFKNQGMSLESILKHMPESVWPDVKDAYNSGRTAEQQDNYSYANCIENMKQSLNKNVTYK